MKIVIVNWCFCIIIMPKLWLYVTSRTCGMSCIYKLWTQLELLKYSVCRGIYKVRLRNDAPF